MGNDIGILLAASDAVTIISAVAALVVGLGIGLVIERISRGAAYQRRDEIIEQARKEAETLKKAQEVAAKEELISRREAMEKELNAAREAHREQARRLDRRDNTLGDVQPDINKKERMVEGLQNKLSERQKQMDAREAELEQVLREERDQLFRISGMSPEAAQDKLLSQLRVELKNETGAVILKHNQELKETCDKLAREAVGMAVQRCAASHASETTVSSVDIPNDEMKGRIIGREGRNIRAFEKITGVDVIVDDTPGAVIFSAFDTVSRAIARVTFANLIQDGRIHPSRIEEIVAETEKEMDEHIRNLGNEAVQEAGIAGVHEKLIMLMGRLNFRVSYSQNVRRHSIEVAYLTGLLAEQLGLDGTLARRCGFFHDIGKAADHEMEGGHPAVGAELLKRYGEGPEVVHAALGHHDDIRVDHIYTVLVASADAISAARPGARR